MKTLEHMLPSGHRVMMRMSAMEDGRVRWRVLGFEGARSTIIVNSGICADEAAAEANFKITCDKLDAQFEEVAAKLRSLVATGNTVPKLTPDIKIELDHDGRLAFAVPMLAERNDKATSGG